MIDGFAGWDPRHQIKVRVICTRAYHALFMRNMLIRPTMEELESFGDPDWVIFNAGQMPAIPELPGVGTRTSVNVNFKTREMVILGTEYAGEMKKGRLRGAQLHVAEARHPEHALLGQRRVTTGRSRSSSDSPGRARLPSPPTRSVG